jgi:hypothetical protein
MSDLNDWRLDYPGVSFEFGTLVTGYPFSVQVDIGDTDISDQDQDHPTTDGVIMGKDKLGGFVLNFDMKLVPEHPLVDEMWITPLDAYSQFRAAWRADAVRRSAGAYATLTNLNRERVVYGRPRKCAPKMEHLRHGLVEFLAMFQTNSPNWYDATEKSSTITPIPPSSSGFFVPVITPLTTTGASVDDSTLLNEGDIEAWPIVEFHGGTNPALELWDGPDLLWTAQVSGGLAFDQVLTLDTRPWSRSATINGNPANGRMRGSAIEQMGIPVGSFFAQYKVTDPSGTAHAVIRWRDTFASL